MVPIMTVLTIIFFIGLDFAFQYAKKRRAARLAEEAAGPVFAGNGHAEPAHANGILQTNMIPLMQDGGEPIEKKEGEVEKLQDG